MEKKIELERALVLDSILFATLGTCVLNHSNIYLVSSVSLSLSLFFLVF
jgi:hypothetical protein